MAEQISPRDVLDLQGDLAELLEEPTSSLSTYLDLVAHNQGVIAEGKQIAGLVCEHLITGRAFRVAANMTEELMRRASDIDTLPTTDRFGFEMRPPRHRGFVVFEAPIRYIEARSRGQIIHVVEWGLTSSKDGTRGYLITAWGDIKREIDEVLRDHGADLDDRWREWWTPANHENKFGRWAPVLTGFLAFGEEVGVPMIRMTEEYAQMIRDMDQTPNYDIPVPHRWWGALWQLLNETVEVEHRTEPTTPSTPRSARGRGVRPEVTVVTLRRPSCPTLHPGTGTKRTTRTWVEGGYEQTFWTGKGRQTPVRRTIAGHWSVGDDNLPIKNRPKVYDLRR